MNVQNFVNEVATVKYEIRGYKSRKLKLIFFWSKCAGGAYKLLDYLLCGYLESSDTFNGKGCSAAPSRTYIHTIVPKSARVLINVVRCARQ